MGIGTNGRGATKGVNCDPGGGGMGIAGDTEIAWGIEGLLIITDCWVEVIGIGGAAGLTDGVIGIIPGLCADGSIPPLVAGAV